MRLTVKNPGALLELELKEALRAVQQCERKLEGLRRAVRDKREHLYVVRARELRRASVERQAFAWLLRYGAGLSYRQISTAIGVNYSTAASAVRRFEVVLAGAFQRARRSEAPAVRRLRAAHAVPRWWDAEVQAPPEEDREAAYKRTAASVRRQLGGAVLVRRGHKLVTVGLRAVSR